MAAAPSVVSGDSSDFAAFVPLRAGASLASDPKSKATLSARLFLAFRSRRHRPLALGPAGRYTWVGLSIIVILNLHLKQRTQLELITGLARTIALANLGAGPAKGPGDSFTPPGSILRDAGEERQSP
jgi:hypothetical protein